MRNPYPAGSSILTALAVSCVAIACGGSTAIDPHAGAAGGREESPSGVAAGGISPTNPPCAEPDAGAGVDAATVGKDAAPSTQPSGQGMTCGPLTCAANEYCQAYYSDIPEYNGSTSKFVCHPLPDCGTRDVCECVRSLKQCDSPFGFGGVSCEATRGGYELVCMVGG